MSSSQRWRPSGNGAASASASASSSSSSSTRRARAAVANPSKKRRYVDSENKCRNPFCGAALANKAQRYCDNSKFCQLRRGIELLCAWPHAPVDDASDDGEDDDDAPLARSVRSGSSRATTTTTAAAAPGASATEASSGDKRPRSGTDALPPLAIPTASKKPRVLQRHASADSIASGAPTTPRATPPATPTAATTAQQVKTATIDVVPLGVGNRPGGGGRYVQSGNRAEINSSTMVRPPSFSRFQTGTPAGAGPETPQTVQGTATPVSVPPPHPQSSVPSASSASSAPPSRTLSRANSLPVTTTNRSRDPRVRVTSTSSSANGDAAPVRKTMSAADYLTMSRNKDAASVPASSSAAPVSSSVTTLASAGPPEQHRSLDRSSSTMRNAPAPSSMDYNGSRPHAQESSAAPLRRAQSDTTQYDASRNDRYLSYRPDGYAQKPPGNAQSSRPGDDWHRPRDGDYGYDPHHSHNNYGASNAYASSHPYDNNSSSRPSNDFSSANSSSSHYGAVDSHYSNRSDDYDRKPSYQNSHQDQRGSSSSSTPYRSEQQNAGGAQTPRESDIAQSSRSSATRVSRAETLFGSLLRPKFSHCDPFVKLILTRMISFLPDEKVGIKAVTYTTTTKRKLKFYLDYAKRVEECCGRLAKLTVEDGVARLTIAGREWISIEGTSTSVLYQQILERLYDDSVRWRSLVEELERIHEREKRKRNGGAINGVSFLKFWSTMKERRTARLDLQSSLTVGFNSFHWVFSVGNIEIGSGTAASKLDAFKAATSSAFTFFDALEILAPEEKYRVAQSDDDGRNGSSRPSSAVSSRPSSGDSASRRATTSSPSSSTRTAISPRANGSSTESKSTASSTAASSNSNRTSSHSSSSTASRSNGPSTDRSSTTSTSSVPASGSSRSSKADNPSGNRASVAAPQTRVPTDRIIDAPPAAGEISRERIDSWTEAVELGAAFSPVVLSERSVSDDDESMSISSTEDQRGDTKPAAIPAPPTTSNRPVPVSSTSAKPAIVAPAPAPAPAAPACRFCELMQRSKPDAMCVKCARQAR